LIDDLIPIASSVPQIALGPAASAPPEKSDTAPPAAASAPPEKSDTAPPAPAAPAVAAAGGRGGDVVSTTNALAFPYFPGMGFPSNAGIPVTPLTAMQSAAVYGCCKCIAEDIAGLRVQIRRATDDGGWIVDRGHPLNRLFRRPNRWQPRFHFWVFVLIAYSLRGNAYMVILRDRVGRPVELVPVWPDSVSVHPPVRGDGYGRVWYTVTSRFLGGTYRVPSENMVHMMNMSFDGFVGLSPIACAQDVVGLALATQQHGAILFRQGGQVGGVLSHPGRIGTETMQAIAQSWRDVHSGVQNAHKIAVLEEGMKYEKIALTNEDAQFLQTRQFQVIDICRLYRVPPHKVGEYGRATFNNLEQQQQQYIDDCLQPHTDQLSDVLGDGLLFDDERGDYEVRFDYSTLLTGDMSQRYSAYQTGLNNGFLNRNEVRAREGMNPIPGGDEYRVPLNTGNPIDPTNAAQQTPRDGDNDGELNEE
jgi:HK97 family phage portal protein